MDRRRLEAIGRAATARRRAGPARLVLLTTERVGNNETMRGKSPDNPGDSCGRPVISCTATASAPIKVGLLDSFAFSRGSLAGALTIPEHGFLVAAFETPDGLVSSGVTDIDVILFYDHEQERPRTLDNSWDAQIREHYGDIPIIVLSDATTALEPQTVRAALKSGIRGFIPAQTFEIGTVSAAIRFVVAGGVFAPIDILLADDVMPTPDRNGSAPPDRFLTPRQTSVLTLLQQGMANKIIAYQHGMSESTVKVHIRNIMRKTGATNRTQAVYKLQQLSRGRATGAYAGL